MSVKGGGNDFCPDKIERRKKKFSSDVRKDIKSKDKTTILMIENWLNQYHLNSRCEWPCIHNTAYERGISAIEAEKQIKNSVRWIRLASYNIIRELSRQNKRQEKFTKDLAVILPSAYENKIDISESQAYHFSRVNDGLKQLSELDRRIVVLTVVKEWNSSKVKTALKEEGFGELSCENIRQRKCRAIKQLKAYYFEGVVENPVVPFEF